MPELIKEQTITVPRDSSIVGNTAEEPVRAKSCFVLMSFDPSFDEVYSTAIRKGRFPGRNLKARSTRNQPVVVKCTVWEQTADESSHPCPNANPPSTDLDASPLYLGFLPESRLFVSIVGYEFYFERT